MPVSTQKRNSGPQNSGVRRREAVMVEISRRTLIKATGAVGATMLPVAPAEVLAQEHHEQPAAAPAAQPSAEPAAPAAHAPTTYLFFNTDEAAFIEPAV